MRHVTFLFLALCFAFSASAEAATATITNNGNIRVRVQYKTADAEYRNIYLNPGESAPVPAGSEKVKVVREVGEWAQPPVPGAVIDVEVKEGDQVVSSLTWYGEKAFFSAPVEGPPPPGETVAAPAAAPAAAEPQVKPETKNYERFANPPSPFWPWFGGLSGSGVTAFFILMMLPFVLSLGRVIIRPRSFQLQPGFGARGCLPVYLLAGIFFGLFLATWGTWGYANYGEGEGFLSLFAADLYLFPIFLVSAAVRVIGYSPESVSAIPHALLIYPFWILLMALLTLPIGRWRAQTLYGSAFLVALLPMLLMGRGCAGPYAYAEVNAYQTAPLLAGAFSSLFVLPLIYIALLNFARPYDAVRYGFEGGRSFVSGCLPLVFSGGLGLLIAVFLLAGLPLLGSEFGALPFFHFLRRVPLMAGLDFLPFSLAVILFWTVAVGGLGFSFRRPVWGPAFYSTFLVSTLALFFLAGSFYPGRALLRQLDDEIYDLQDASWYGETTVEEDNLLDFLEDSGLVPTLEEREGASLGGFGDQVGFQSGARRRVFVRDAVIGLLNPTETNDRQNQQN
ncbi:MAG: hypothetical protein Q8R76_06150 [Candidatus Omnitrophota bacterium]|nr:hypothetical protein [Candidatus Omnitrophota bacterium]